jgi:putative inorganic carbon (HCO3(-)) transporter
VATNLGVQGLIVFLFFVLKMMSSLNNGIRSVKEQKRKIQQILDDVGKGTPYFINAQKHKKDLDLIEATSRAVILFLIVRLALGVFGMDLYEIYWWFSLGLVVSLYNILKWSKIKTEKISSQ